MTKATMNEVVIEADKVATKGVPAAIIMFGNLKACIADVNNYCYQNIATFDLVPRPLFACNTEKLGMDLVRV